MNRWVPLSRYLLGKTCHPPSTVWIVLLEKLPAVYHCCESDIPPETVVGFQMFRYDDPPVQLTFWKTVAYLCPSWMSSGAPNSRLCPGCPAPLGLFRKKSWRVLNWVICSRVIRRIGIVPTGQYISLPYWSSFPLTRWGVTGIACPWA